MASPLAPPPPPPHPGRKPIMMTTHPRACSTAFERVMMTRPELLTCMHEPFGEAFYYSHAERLGSRYGLDSDQMRQVRQDSGHSQTTYRNVFDLIELQQQASGGRRVFIKDIAHYLVPPAGEPKIAPSLAATATATTAANGAASGAANRAPANGAACGTAPPPPPKNPTVVPLDRLKEFQWTFLIRDPVRSIPSYFRCTQPPLAQLTGFDHFLPEEAGYRELRLLLDYLRATGVVADGSLFVLDADDLLEHPAEAIRRYCAHVGVDYSPQMLRWEKGVGCEAFDKWKGFHEDAIASDGLRKREKKHADRGLDDEERDWAAKWGPDAAALIRKTVVETTPDYEYLRSFKQQF